MDGLKYRLFYILELLINVYFTVAGYCTEVPEYIWAAMVIAHGYGQKYMDNLKM